MKLGFVFILIIIALEMHTKFCIKYGICFFNNNTYTSMSTSVPKRQSKAGQLATEQLC